MSTIINVTQEDIDNGVRESACECAVARAVGRAFPGAHVEVDVDHIVVDQGSTFDDVQPDIYKCSTVVADFVCDYDNNFDVQPFSFDLDDLRRA